MLQDSYNKYVYDHEFILDSSSQIIYDFNRAQFIIYHSLICDAFKCLCYDYSFNHYPYFLFMEIPYNHIITRNLWFLLNVIQKILSDVQRCIIITLDASLPILLPYVFLFCGNLTSYNANLLGRIMEFVGHYIWNYILSYIAWWFLKSCFPLALVTLVTQFTNTTLS